MPSTPQTIPTYALYGEHTSDDLRELVHCETIASRSTLYDWEIAPHCHAALSQVLFLSSGEARILQNGTHHDAKGPVLVIAPADTVHGFRFSEGASGFVLSMATDFLNRFAPDDPLTTALAQNRITQLDQPTRRNLRVLGHQLVSANSQGSDMNQILLQHALAEAWLRSALSWHMQPEQSQADPQLHRFHRLIERHYRDHLPLEFYAQTLGCTERTLARLTQRGWGVTPTHAINTRLATEAQRLLRFTNADCATVGQELGFDDPSYFSRFYLRMMGRRPSAEKP